MEHIAILDFGSQYTHLIARSIRELKVLAQIYPHNTKASILKKNKAIGTIISGGPQSVFKEDSISVDANIFKLGIPVLGLCYGHQLMAHLLGGEVKRGRRGEYGKTKLQITEKSELFSGVKNNSVVWMSHGDSVQKLPTDFITTASTADCPITGMANIQKNFYGLQFHPEVEHSEYGKEIIKNFVSSVCFATPNWQVSNLVNDLLAKIKTQAGNKNVFILVSGGVDSNVALALLTKALGEKRVIGLYIDTGFMRANESKEIIKSYARAGFRNLKTIEASEIFFNKLSGVSEPEEKRHLIGQTFLDVKDKAIKELGLDQGNWLLGQGTIYPDTIESGGTKNADKIKTHHNRVDAIQLLIKKGLIIEPLVDFYKDEVRQIGKLLGLPNALINRHPFPGPGLAIRCLCFDKQQKLTPNKLLDKKLAKIYQEKHPQVKYSVLPVRSVGVQGDNRTYANPLAVWGEKKWPALDSLSSLTTNSIKEINRVLLLLNNEKNPRFLLPDNNLYLTEKRIKTLRKIDAIVMAIIKKAGYYDKIWQFPVILIPICDRNGRESIVLRPFVSRDVMTLEFARLEKHVLKNLVKEILSTNEISYVFYDLTNKPPGTVEWE